MAVIVPAVTMRKTADQRLTNHLLFDQSVALVSCSSRNWTVGGAKDLAWERRPCGLTLCSLLFFFIIHLFKLITAHIILRIVLRLIHEGIKCQLLLHMS